MNEIEYIASFFGNELKRVFSVIDVNILSRITEIRIRRNCFLIVVIKNTSYFIDYNGDLYDYPSSCCVFIGSEEFERLFMSLCDYSVYSNAENLKNGFITLENGSRIGVAGTAVYDSQRLVSIKDIYSLNIRIAKQVKNCSEEILNSLYVNTFPSVIIAGRPNSGKTTLLRDMARLLSSGFNNRFAKIAIVDERNEICAKRTGDNSLDVGINTDVLTSFSKAKGIEIATRTLSPDMIICDEAATKEEVDSILFGFSSGVSFALSVHISSKKDLLFKPIIKTLLETREFSYIILLDNHTYKPEIIDAGEIFDEICRNDNSDYRFNRSGILF